MNTVVKDKLTSTAISDLIHKCEIILKGIEDEQCPAIDKLLQELKHLVTEAEKLRRDILISKTTGTSVATLGSVLTIIGFCIAPLTLGISAVVLPAVGVSFAVAGAGTNIAASIADSFLSKDQAVKISDKLEDFKILQKRCDSNEDQFVNEFKKTEAQFVFELKKIEFLKKQQRSMHNQQLANIAKMFRSGHLHRDEKVNEMELRYKLLHLSDNN